MGTIRKILTTGVGAALMTENGIRNAISEIQVTRQARDYITRQALKGKEEFSKIFIGELKKFLERINIHEEIQKALNGLSFEVEAKLRIVPPARGDHSKVAVKKLTIKRV